MKLMKSARKKSNRSALHTAEEPVENIVREIIAQFMENIEKQVSVVKKCCIVAYKDCWINFDEVIMVVKIIIMYKA